MIEEAVVFDAVRRGYNELGSTSPDEIISYFTSIDTDAALDAEHVPDTELVA